MKKVMMTAMVLFASFPALAEEAAAATEAATMGGNTGLLAIAAGLAIALTGLGGALGQGRIGAAAMEGIARNPQASKQMFVPLILGLVLIESLVIYGLVIAFTLAGKL